MNIKDNNSSLNALTIFLCFKEYNFMFIKKNLIEYCFLNVNVLLRYFRLMFKVKYLNYLKTPTEILI